MTNHRTPIPAPRPAVLAAQRFPLVPRRQIIARPVPVRISQIRTRADGAAAGGPNALQNAAGALNLAALLASDCGQPGLARELCWRQFDQYGPGPHPVDITKLTLQPLINLARLHVRDGHGSQAFDALNALSTAVEQATTARIDGRTIDMTRLVRPDLRPEICEWLQEIVFTDGLRALARSGRWTEAADHAKRLHGIGQRLEDARQIAVLARCFEGDRDGAYDLIRSSALTDHDEVAVAACLVVLCLQDSGRSVDVPSERMTNAFLKLAPDPTLLTFATRLGLTIVDLLDEESAMKPVIDRMAAWAAGTDGGYCAREIVAHPAAALLTDSQRAGVNGGAAAVGLGAHSLSDQSLTDLTTASNVAAEAIHRETRADH